MSEARTLDRPARFVAKHRERTPIQDLPSRRPHLLGNVLCQEPEYRGLELQRIRQSLGLSGQDIADAIGVPIAKIVEAECEHPRAYEVRQREQAWLRQHILAHWPRVEDR